MSALRPNPSSVLLLLGGTAMLPAATTARAQFPSSPATRRSFGSSHPHGSSTDTEFLQPWGQVDTDNGRIHGGHGSGSGSGSRTASGSSESAGRAQAALDSASQRAYLSGVQRSHGQGAAGAKMASQ